MHFPRNRTRWDKYMLQDISNYNFYGRSELVRLRGKYTVQTAHCAVEIRKCDQGIDQPTDLSWFGDGLHLKTVCSVV